jgi:predicted RNA-binding protein with PUA-like domain
MRHWLMKTEPDEFSIDDLARVKREPWSGVRNYTARNFMRDLMKPGDGVLFYHSSCEIPGVYGVAEIAGAAYADPTQFDRKSDYYDEKSPRDNPRWLTIDVKYKRKLKHPVTLDRLRAEPALAKLQTLQRGNRLSITPVEPEAFDLIVGMGAHT